MISQNYGLSINDCYYYITVNSHIFCSAQGGCTITPINPTTLTAAGGVLASGTVNVTIRCKNCTGGNITLNRVRWYDPDGTRIISTVHKDYVPGTPHFTTFNGAGNDIILVIPTFNDSYDGTYTCGRRVDSGPPEPPNAVVTLTIGKLMIHVRVYKYMYVCMSLW